MNKLVKYIIESRFNFNIDLLDIEDNGEEFSLSKQLYKSKSMKEEYIENSLFVDLGLPSSTKWCKYNLGCDFGLLSSNPENTKPEDWYGKYYAWGESEDKDDYEWETYKFEKNISDKGYNLIKYCTKSKYGYEEFTDDLTELLPEDDIAYQTNPNWRIPTKELFDELLKYTNSEWISGKNNNLYMNVKDLAGKLFTSKINGNQLFIPVAGSIWKSSLDDGSYCQLWSSSLVTDGPGYAWILGFSSNHMGMNYGYRYCGCSVRSILNKNN